ncbi:TPA: MSHA biogenesis protein MshQ [Aeromonas sobria]|nr:MSHA biogenesis protein MshQ [Aeromonas sobria]HEH9429307.1 MSHA biogenesis protein MshQ [Aeromonas sobria]
MHNSWFIAIIWLFSGAASAFEVIDIPTYFPAVVQGHRGDTSADCNGVKNSMLEMNGQAKINGTAGATLNFCKSNQGAGMPWDACDGSGSSRRFCTINNNTIKGMSVSGTNDFLSSNGTAGGLDGCQAGQIGGGANNQFGVITLRSNCSLSFSNMASEYRIKELTMEEGTTLVLPSGDYWIGTLSMRTGSEIKVQGMVRIFVNNSAEFTGATLNGAADGALLLVGYRNITLNSNAKINGYIYSDESVVMNSAAVVGGRITSKRLTMSGQSTINNQDFTPSLTCFSDNFDSPPLKPEWVVKTSKGTFSPSIQEGRLRLTENKNDQATSLTYLKLFPAANNLVTVEFDHSAYGGTGADGIAMVLSDAKITPQPGAFGGPLGYGHKGSTAPGFAGGWLGVGIDEFGNFSAEGGSNNQPSRKNSIAIRGSGSGTTGYRYLYGSATLSPAIHNGKNYPNPPHRYRLTVDSRSGNTTMVSLERNVGAGYATVSGISSFDASKEPGQSSIPEDFYLSFTGSTGGSNNKHDIDNVKICALKVNPVGVPVHHFEFSHSGQGITCQPEGVTIKACANADCSQLMSETVTAALTPHPITNGGWSSGSGLNNVKNGIVTITNGVTKVMLSNYSANSITMGVSSSTPPLRPQSDTLCRSGSLGPAKQYCTLPFADAALRFNVPTFYAGTSGTTSIRAIKSNDAGATKVCVPLLTGDQTLQFASSKVVSEASGAVPMVNSTAIAPSGNVKVAFNSDGVGQLTVQYPDAGVLRLDATFQKSDATGTLRLIGSDTFAVLPSSILLRGKDQPACSGTDDASYMANCDVYSKAGAEFTLQAQAVNQPGNPTPGFGATNLAVQWARLAPLTGVNGTVSPALLSISKGVSSTIAKWDEVGVLKAGITDFVPYPGYQDETPQLKVPLRWSAPIGRFVPWDYSLSGGFITPACNAFTYMSQPFASGFVLTARNLQKGTTQNYQGAFAKGVAEMVAANALDGVARDKRITLSSSLSWASGVASINQQLPFGLNTRFDRAASPEAPFATLSFGIKVDDKDGGTTRLANPNMNAAVAGACAGASCDAVRLGTQKLLYGRLLAGTEAGVASAPLAIPQRMQYYEAGNWLLNKEDQCTQLSLANQGFTFLNPSHTFDAATRELNLGAGRKIKLGLGSSAPGGDAALAKDGEILLHFAKPDISVRIPYKVDLAKQPSSPTWLSDPTSLQGEAIFGSSRGNDRIIYRREVMQ